MSAFTFLLQNSSSPPTTVLSATTEKVDTLRQTRYAQRQKRVRGKDFFLDRRENMQALQDHVTKESFICRGQLKIDV